MSENAQPPANHLGAKFWIKTVLTVLVLMFVGWRAWELVDDQNFSLYSICPGWLVLSGLFYALGWGPSIWFWRNLLQSMGQFPGWIRCGKAYYVGHLGKYVPGKAGALVLRAGVTKGDRCSFGAGVLTATYETITVMGIGLVVAGTLAPILVPQETLNRWSESIPFLIESRWVPGFILCTIAVISIPLVSILMAKVARKFSSEDVLNVRITHSQLAKGYFAFLFCWGLQGLALGAALQSVSDRPFSLAGWPVWTAAVAASTSIGFFSVFTPGGLGVREGIMIEILRIRPEMMEARAVFAVVLLRLVSLATEGGMYLGCSWLLRRDDLANKLSESSLSNSTK